MAKVYTFFAEGSGLPSHVAHKTGELGTVRLFACGEPMPHWWAPKARHAVDPAKLIAVECGKCAAYVRRLLERRKDKAAAKGTGKPRGPYKKNPRHPLTDAAPGG